MKKLFLVLLSAFSLQPSAFVFAGTNASMMFNTNTLQVPIAGFWPSNAPAIANALASIGFTGGGGGTNTPTLNGTNLCLGSWTFGGTTVVSNSVEVEGALASGAWIWLDEPVTGAGLVSGIRFLTNGVAAWDINSYRGSTLTIVDDLNSQVDLTINHAGLVNVGYGLAVSGGLTNYGAYVQTNTANGANLTVTTNAHFTAVDEFGNSNITRTWGGGYQSATNTIYDYSSNGSHYVSGQYNGSGAGLTALPTSQLSGAIAPSQLNAAQGGTPGSTTYYRGDGAWATPAGGGGSGTATNLAPNLNATNLTMVGPVSIAGGITKLTFVSTNPFPAGSGSAAFSLTCLTNITTPGYSVSGATNSVGATNVNQNYYLFSSNNSTGEVIWTNPVNAVLLVDNDPACTGKWLLEIGTGATNVFYNQSRGPTGGWSANACGAVGSSPVPIVTGMYVTNYVTTISSSGLNPAPTGFPPAVVPQASQQFGQPGYFPPNGLGQTGGPMVPSAYNGPYPAGYSMPLISVWACNQNPTFMQIDVSTNVWTAANQILGYAWDPTQKRHVVVANSLGGFAAFADDAAWSNRTTPTLLYKVGEETSWLSSSVSGISYLNNQYYTNSIAWVEWLNTDSTYAYSTSLQVWFYSAVDYHSNYPPIILQRPNGWTNGAIQATMDNAGHIVVGHVLGVLGGFTSTNFIAVYTTNGNFVTNINLDWPINGPNGLTYDTNYGNFYVIGADSAPVQAMSIFQVTPAGHVSQLLKALNPFTNSAYSSCFPNCICFSHNTSNALDPNCWEIRSAIALINNGNTITYWNLNPTNLICEVDPVTQVVYANAVTFPGGAAVSQAGVKTVATNFFAATAMSGWTNTNAVNWNLALTASSATTISQFDNAGNFWATTTNVTGLMQIGVQPGGGFTTSGTVVAAGHASTP